MLFIVNPSIHRGDKKRPQNFITVKTVYLKKLEDVTMRKKILLLLIFCLLIFQNNLFASEKAINKTYLKNLAFSYNKSYFNDDVLVPFENEGKIVKGLKSYKKAILYSALIPGAGEIYTGSLIKGLAFVGVEALCWTVYFTSNNKGKDIKGEFHLYSAAHWSKCKSLDK